MFNNVYKKTYRNEEGNRPTGQRRFTVTEKSMESYEGTNTFDFVEAIITGVKLIVVTAVTTITTCGGRNR